MAAKTTDKRKREVRTSERLCKDGQMRIALTIFLTRKEERKAMKLSGKLVRPTDHMVCKSLKSICEWLICDGLHHKRP
ncbi:MAG: hypothetical protein ACOYD4_04060 [Solirubrobacterales bacterium]